MFINELFCGTTMSRITLDSQKFDIERIARSLYDFQFRGIVPIHGFMRGSTLDELVREINEHRDQFQQAPYRVNETEQVMRGFWLGEADPERIQGEFPAIMRLRDAYLELYEQLARRARFRVPIIGTNHLNSIAVNVYEGGPVGIGPHRDESMYANMISIFSLDGNADLVFYENKERRQTATLRCPPGMLTLLRAPRSEGEKPFRPYHAVRNVSPGRISLTFREKIA
jgi:alkylated DNA repair dioxygenase AlkB